MLIAANTFRSTGAVLFAIGAALILGYLIYNYVVGRREVGAEVELAANRKPYLDDEQLETRKLDMSLTMGLGLLGVIGLALPLYWLGEPGRHEGYEDFTVGQLTSRGEGLYEELCAQCHGGGGVGGSAPFTVLDEQGRFVASVTWKAPALTSALYRFSDDEVRYVLNYGRQNSPMPAWGGPGGGPLTSQQIDELILYIQSIQLSPEELAEDVQSGIRDQVTGQVNARYEAQVLADNPELAPDDNDDDDAAAARAAELREAVSAALEADGGVDAIVDETMGGLNQLELGELVFNNTAAAGAYSCARCHTAGWSWDADAAAADPAQPFRSLIPLQVSGGGGFGPNLTNGATVRQFPDPADHSTFIGAGSQDGVAYGEFGQGDGGGQMPAFGVCVGDRDAAEFSPFVGFCDIEVDGVVTDRGGMLTPEQIEAVVAYERSL